MSKSILIAASSIDSPTWKPVAADLSHRGYDVIAYEADRVARGEVSFTVKVGDETGLTVNYDNRELFLGNVAAAWYRRANLISSVLQKDRAKQIGLDRERTIIQSALWDTVPECAWLSSPDKIHRAEKKLTQLSVARKVGFAIPDTIITNDWDAITRDLPEDIIFKTSYPYIMFNDNGSTKTVYTTPLKNNLSELPVAGNPFPGIWQPNLGKAREWRITVVGDETFDAAIYTSEDAKDDWRKHQGSSHMVEFRSEPFSDEHRAKCLRYLGEMGLRFGAFDFTEDGDGKVTFLECNANGQFGWLEDVLGLPVSSAIGSELASIAERA